MEPGRCSERSLMLEPYMYKGGPMLVIVNPRSNYSQRLAELCCNLLFWIEYGRKPIRKWTDAWIVVCQLVEGGMVVWTGIDDYLYVGWSLKWRDQKRKQWMIIIRQSNQKRDFDAEANALRCKYMSCQNSDGKIRKCKWQTTKMVLAKRVRFFQATRTE